MLSKVGKMLSKCQTAWIWMRRRVNRRLIQILAVCIWNYSSAWRAKCENVSLVVTVRQNPTHHMKFDD